MGTCGGQWRCVEVSAEARGGPVEVRETLVVSQSGVFDIGTFRFSVVARGCSMTGRSSAYGGS